VIDQTLTSLLVHCKPSDIPAQLTVDISDLEIGGAKHVSDIELPEGVTTSVEAEETVVTASFQVVEIPEPEEGEEVEGEEAAEGEAAEGEAGEAAEGEGGGESEGGDAGESGGDEG
jgi:large subunit ribosomal protein L25